MNWETRKYTRALKRYDSLLYAEMFKDKVCVYRKIKKLVRLLECEDFGLSIVKEEPQFVMALTSDWTLRGSSVGWGLDRVLDRLKQMDQFEDEKLIEEMDRKNERVEESKKKAFRSRIEDAARDMRSVFAKQTEGIMTHSLPKIDPRQKGDRRHGNR